MKTVKEAGPSSITRQQKVTPKQQDSFFSPQQDLIQDKNETAFFNPVRQNKFIQRKQGEEFGQSAEGTTRHMISDLTSPIRIGSAPRFEIRQHGAEIGPTGAKMQYRWSVIDRNTKKVIATTTTDENSFRIPATTAGNYTVKGEILSNGTAFSQLSLDQDVIAEDSFLTNELNTMKGDPDTTAAYRELVNDFGAYIINAAQSTGSNGITPALLAAVLMVEVSNRPKAGRESEINDVGQHMMTLNKGESLYPWQSINHSLGVGQIRLNTAAMVLGYTPWVDQDRNNRSAGRDKIQENFKGTSLAQKNRIFELLKWPKSNIQVAANLLSKLKNRANRYPSMDRLTFANDHKAVAIIATEYNQGSSTSAEADASPSGYGEWVWNYISSDPIINNYFPNK